MGMSCYEIDISVNTMIMTKHNVHTRTFMSIKMFNHTLVFLCILQTLIFQLHCTLYAQCVDLFQHIVQGLPFPHTSTCLWKSSPFISIGNKNDKVNIVLCMFCYCGSFIWRSSSNNQTKQSSQPTPNVWTLPSIASC